MKVRKEENEKVSHDMSWPSWLYISNFQQKSCHLQATAFKNIFMKND